MFSVELFPYPDLVSSRFETYLESLHSSDVSQSSLVFPKRGLLTLKSQRHNPAEYCSPEDCMNGAQVLMGAVLRYDTLRAQRSNK